MPADAAIRLDVRLEGHRVRVVTRSDLLAPRVLATSATSARVTLVATTALLLGGDEVDLHVYVGPGATLDLSDIAATVAYDGRGAACRWSARVEVAPGARFVWREEPFVVADGADASRELVLDVASGARAWVRDTVVLGRHGERGGDLVASTVLRVDGRPALVETLDLRAARGAGPALRDLPGVLRRDRVVDQLTIVGADLPTPSTGADVPGLVTLDPEGPARLLRWTGADTHLSPIGAILAGGPGWCRG
ncbi:urease accessory protein UreD [Agilicoccus flavus]|uniref:urease accessory protein UreD n=1 Tax=Agilicoccus flavus TaxID=2775968 RepID=UPI001CF64EF3|nr:urease accessory protein UreD [Agilicoccus flavus]